MDSNTREEFLAAATSRARILAKLNPEPNKQGEHGAIDEFLPELATAVDEARAAYAADECKTTFRYLHRVEALQKACQSLKRGVISEARRQLMILDDFTD